ncbi:calcium-dependent lipid-binding family protein [Striga asiatica]|uniref:Calcium-dependent lipid-binding family protein n=1 Tax=Striga asiatica TaxID=4170 RepID=A0A5A7PVQ9_STRAF|nr:calcium-dependent lipid-binding family protein [Striga asiatica]
MSICGIQGQLLEVTVVGCNKLKDTEWISRQDPYVCLEYASTKYRTRTCTDGGKNPTFQEKFVFTLIEGLREFSVVIWNSNTLTFDDFIGSGKIQLQKVLLQGYDDSSWPLQDKRGRYSGEVRLIMHYANANLSITFSLSSECRHLSPTALSPAPLSLSLSPDLSLSSKRYLSTTSPRPIHLPSTRSISSGSLSSTTLLRTHFLDTGWLKKKCLAFD